MPDGPSTRAERTRYEETSLHADVMAFVRELEARSKSCRVLEIGRSHEGREMPLLVLSNRGLFDPRAARESGLPVVLVINNIHAGEVEGKEASLILAREIALGPLRPLADSAVLLILPLFNVDGNERISAKHRALDLVRLDGQIGPDGGVGTRYTAAGLNLNRDYVKVETVEMAHLNREVYYRWRPHLTIDCHTTDGSIHGFDLTYGTAMNPAAHPAPREYVRTRLLPSVTQALLRRTGIRTFFYGNYIDALDPAKGWATYSHKPRYGSNYRGLAFGMDVLSETYSYLPFDERVRVNREFLQEIFQHVGRNGSDVVRIVREAQEETARLRGDQVAIQARLERYDEPVEIVRRGFTVDVNVDTTGPAMRMRYHNFTRGADVEAHRIPFFGRFVGTKSVLRPRAYAIPHHLTRVLERLNLHDISFRTLSAQANATVERFRVASVNRLPSPDYGDTSKEEIALEGAAERETKALPAGTVLVPTDQAQGNLIVYLLEAGSDDGLATWGFIEPDEGGMFPIERVLDGL
jgi:hypothetical protein